MISLFPTSATSSSRGRLTRLLTDICTCCHTETALRYHDFSVAAGHIILTLNNSEEEEEEEVEDPIKVD